MRRVITTSLLAGLLAVAGCGTAPSTRPSPDGSEAVTAPTRSQEVKAMLWVGNSFFYSNNSMHEHVSNMLLATQVYGTRGVSATISGSGISWHDVDSYFRPGGVGNFSFVGDNEVQFNTFDKPFDAVLMMDCSQCPIHPQLKPMFYEYVAKHSATVRKYGAEPILFMSWAYKDKPEMTALLAAEYVNVGKLHNALVVPAGLAFAKAMANRPELNLYVPDKRHPSMAGTYLAACTVLASVYKANPQGMKYTAGLNPITAAFLQEVAWETAQEFHAREGRGNL